MRDITTIVCPKRLLYLWDLHYQLIDDSDYELINNFTEYKHIMSQYLENYADILDTTILSEEEVRRAKKGYKLVRELVQLNYLLTCNDPTIKRGYMDLHLSGESRYLISGGFNASQILFDVKFEGAIPGMTQLELLATFYTRSKNLFGVVSKKLGINKPYDPEQNPLANYMSRLSDGFKLHIYRPITGATGLSNTEKDIDFLCNFYEKVPELQVKHYFAPITTALKVFDFMQL